MTKFIRHRSYIMIEEDEEVWIFEDELPGGDSQPLIEASPRYSIARRLVVLTLTTAGAVGTSVAASVLYDNLIR